MKTQELTNTSQVDTATEYAESLDFSSTLHQAIDGGMEVMLMTTDILSERNEWYRRWVRERAAEDRGHARIVSLELNPEIWNEPLQDEEVRQSLESMASLHVFTGHYIALSDEGSENHLFSFLAKRATPFGNTKLYHSDERIHTQFLSGSIQEFIYFGGNEFLINDDCPVCAEQGVFYPMDEHSPLSYTWATVKGKNVEDIQWMLDQQFDHLIMDSKTALEMGEGEINMENFVASLLAEDKIGLSGIDRAMSDKSGDFDYNDHTDAPMLAQDEQEKDFACFTLARIGRIREIHLEKYGDSVKYVK